jgi:molybdopterin converting factor small subunit
MKRMHVLQVTITPALASSVGAPTRSTIRATDLAQVLERLAADYPGLQQALVASSGRLPRYIRIFVNGGAIADPLSHEGLQEGDEIAIISAVAGG